MTNNVYPPDHLLRKWESLIIDEEQNVDVVLYEAFQAGADQELEACCEVLTRELICDGKHVATDLRNVRRPQPPSLKDEVKQIIDCLIEGDCLNDEDALTLRRALEALPE